MHEPLDSKSRAALQELSVPSAENISRAKSRRKAQRSSKPKRALGPMTEPARLRALDWLMHQVGARKAERPPAYTVVALTFMEHFNDSDGKAYPSQETLAKLSGIGKSTVGRMIKLHLADGNIRVVEQGTPGRGHPTTYAIVIEPLPDDVAEARRRIGLREDRRKRAMANVAENPSRYAS
jgi:Helix-turn-helix domain